MKPSPLFKVYTYESSKLTHIMYNYEYYLCLSVNKDPTPTHSFSHTWLLSTYSVQEGALGAGPQVMNKTEFQWNPCAIEGNAHETTNYRVNCSIIIVLNSTKNHLQVVRRTYSRGSDAVERSGRLGETSGEINEH